MAGTEAAFFDLDKTVIARASVVAFSRQFYREGLVTRRVLAQGLWAQVMFLRFGARAKTLERLRHKMLRLTTGWEQERVRHIVAETLAQVVGPITYKEAVELIEDHKAAGRRVYIVSAAPAEIVEPLAGYLGAEEAISSHAVVKAGRYTGQMLSYAYGPQKAATILQVAERDGLDLAHSWAYTDSATDLPMLEAVGHPVAVNPDRVLRRIAQMRGWPVLNFSELAVVTPAGHRPLKAGLVGTAGAVVMGGLLLGLVVILRRHAKTLAGLATSATSAASAAAAAATAGATPTAAPASAAPTAGRLSSWAAYFLDATKPDHPGGSQRAGQSGQVRFGR